MHGSAAVSRVCVSEVEANVGGVGGGKGDECNGRVSDGRLSRFNDRKDVKERRRGSEGMKTSGTDGVVVVVVVVG